MKTIAPALLAEYQGSVDTIADAVRIQRQDGQVYRLTSHDRNVTLDVGSGDELYLAQPGYELSQLVSTAGLAVDNAEFRFLADSGFFNRADMLAGRLDVASVLLLQYAWKNPSAGVHILKAGWLGNLKPKRAEFVAEFRDLRQALQFNTTWVTQPTCRNELGDALCTVDTGPYTYGETVGSVASQRQFTAAGLVQAADYFGNGLLTWLTGDNAGITAKVRDFSAGGVVELFFPMVFAIQPGDTFSIVAGCRKRHARAPGLSDCRDKFANHINFNGEWNRPNPDEAIAPQRA